MQGDNPHHINPDVGLRADMWVGDMRADMESAPTDYTSETN
jgi:hypothetical protein